MVTTAKLATEEPKLYPQIYDLAKKDSLESVLGVNHNGATVLIFYANWCGPCKEIKPYIQRRAVAMKEDINEKCPRVVRINIDHHHELADKFAVFSIPCMVLIKNNRPVEYLQSTDRVAIDGFFMKAEVIGFA